jgi:hypothetical protein
MPEKSERPQTRTTPEKKAATRSRTFEEPPSRTRRFNEGGGHQMVSGAQEPARPAERPASPPPSGGAQKK